MLATNCLLMVFLLDIIQPIASKTEKPNIILIVADDMGWNDVGFHGCNQLQTSNIDALAYNGLILNRHYTLPSCTPSRAALMTGKYTIRTGLQGDPPYASSRCGLPIADKLLPQYLKDLGYKTHLVGKWHLGFFEKKYTPTKRGFDTHFGYYNGWVRYNDSVLKTRDNWWGIDARRNLEHAGEEVAGKYLTDVFTDEAVRIIQNHDHQQPLFLELSHAAVHAIKYAATNLPVADVAENDQKFSYIRNGSRRSYAGMVYSLDQSVGKVITALHKSKLLENSIILFMADNGAPTVDPVDGFGNTGSNWPLRGMKTSFFDGGVRGAAAIWSPLLKHKHVTTNELFHISDWLPTLVTAAGGTLDNGFNLDGVDQWSYLTGQQAKSSRHEVLVNIDHKKGLSAIICKKWKLVHCNVTYKESYADHYAGIPGRNDSEVSYNMDLVLDSAANTVLSQYSAPQSSQLFDQIRQSADIEESCQQRINAGLTPRGEQCRENLLFNLEKDPCEFHNIEAQAPDTVEYLRGRLEYFNSQAVPQQVCPADSAANPSRFGGYWTWWVDWPEDLNGVAVVSSGLAILVAVALYKIR